MSGGFVQWGATSLVAAVGGGGVAQLIAVWRSGKLFAPQARQIDAEARTETVTANVALSAEQREWVQTLLAAAEASAKDAAAARSEAVAAWRDREAEARKVATLERRVEVLERERGEQAERIDTLEAVIREARLTLPPWPARRGMPH